jgi:hypothetical protein
VLETSFCNSNLSPACQKPEIFVRLFNSLKLRLHACL